MGKILVTAASGYLGRKTLQHLLKRRPASDLIGLARDPQKAADLAAQGIEIRKGDYFDYDSLLNAFADVEKLMLISCAPFTDRNTQHYNAITAARQAGVKHVAYTAIIRREGSNFNLSECTAPDIFAEQTLKASGLTYTIVRQPAFLETFQFQFGDKVYEKGLRVPAGDGKQAPASREDIAEAQAVVLTEEGHDNKTYSLTGEPAVSYADIAQILSDARGVPVPLIPVTDEEYMANYAAEGLPEPYAAFALEWVHAVNLGEWGDLTGDLERLIGHKPLTTAEYLRHNYPTPVPSIEAAKRQ
ncbi:SDR family oxidoreductase [Rhizobium sullae]|uniref:NAD(P)-dependent oxidoreductase n=1 Tax=Rhizobium sullae TaxID=50338 RepID=A0A2N0DDB7_RHISU|nr:SDR family oxidoreductase [Rhizobium sullae]PKA44097.1 NAD(P)-dependent oxidoreductase [Rhizobium sullae]UWU14329.1 SDR family oxidoreductase [Rhizobium sullae]